MYDGEHVHPVSARLMHGASSFLEYLATEPDGDSALKALSLGPLAHLHPISVIFFGTDSHRHSLRPLGQFGLLSPWNRSNPLPLSWRTPMTHAFLTNAQVFSTSAEIRTGFPTLVPWLDGAQQVSRQAHAGLHGHSDGHSDGQLDGHVDGHSDGQLDGHMDGHVGEHVEISMVNLPVRYAGVSLGVWTIILPGWVTISDEEKYRLNGLSGALAMWQEICRLRRSETLIAKAPTKESGSGLSDRQLQILSLIRDGRSNDSIARALGFSVGTIKVEIQAMFAALSATSRQELVTHAEMLGIAMAPPSADGELESQKAQGSLPGQ